MAKLELKRRTFSGALFSLAADLRTPARLEATLGEEVARDVLRAAEALAAVVALRGLVLRVPDLEDAGFAVRA
ncbi:MAG: hypothetical protein M3N22_05430 [Acidobacteriota bacterium]|nr:hypothetical protein [Acidobacteriota bacterium]